MTRKREAIWKKWRGLMREQARSGQTVAAFCRERNLCAPHFFEWKRKLAQAGRAAGAGFVEVKIAAAVERRAGQAIEAVLAGGRRLRIEPGFERGHLLAVIEALEARQ